MQFNLSRVSFDLWPIIWNPTCAYPVWSLWNPLRQTHLNWPFTKKSLISSTRWQQKRFVGEKKKPDLKESNKQINYTLTIVDNSEAKKKKKVNKLCKQWGIHQISLNRFKVKGGNDGKRELTHASDSQKGQEYMHRMWRRIRSASGNRNKAHLKRKSRSLWRQPKNSHVSPNVAEGFWRRCSSLKVNTQRMQSVNQYGQTTGPDGGGRVLPHSGG